MGEGALAVLLVGAVKAVFCGAGAAGATVLFWGAGVFLGSCVGAVGVAGGTCGLAAAVAALTGFETGGTEVVGGTGVGAGGCGADIQGLF